jgi:hypothetical protein
MPVIIVGAEKNFAALRPRLFEGRISNTVAGDVADSIRAANPDVNLDKLEPGTVLTVPDHPKLAVRGRVSVDSTSKQVAAALADRGAAALDELQATAKTVTGGAAADRKQVSALLSSSELAAATRKDKRLGDALKAAAEAVAAEDAAAKEQQSALTAAAKEWTGELAALKAIVGPTD